MGIPLHQKPGGAHEPGGGRNTLSPASSVGQVSHQPLKGKELGELEQGLHPRGECVTVQHPSRTCRVPCFGAPGLPGGLRRACQGLGLPEAQYHVSVHACVWHGICVCVCKCAMCVCSMYMCGDTCSLCMWCVRVVCVWCMHMCVMCLCASSLILLSSPR